MQPRRLRDILRYKTRASYTRRPTGPSYHEARRSPRPTRRLVQPQVRSSSVPMNAFGSLIRLAKIACASLAGCAVAVASMAEANARLPEQRVHRAAMFRAGPSDFRGARQAERAQQRGLRPAGPQRAVEREAAPVPQAPPPAFRPPDPVPQPERGGRPGRLTPDERRALRQQIDEAGRDVYRPTRP